MSTGATVPTNYEYDVFFSYKRHDLVLDWTRGVYTRLEFWLDQELPQKSRCFADLDSIETGEVWPESLKRALRLSRCLVCVWSPSYFQSSWCFAEWSSFRERERKLNLDSHGLIAPLRFHDGDHFPPDARSVQWTDVAPYTSTVPEFWTSRRAQDLDDVLKAFAGEVARIIQRAPAFQNDWPIVEPPALTIAPIGLARL